MSEVDITVRENKTEYRPREEISGEVRWNLNEAPKAIEVRLFWYTSGKGTTDVEIVDDLRFDNPAARESRPYRFTLPEGPYSFSGKLISLLWALELEVEGGDSNVARYQFVLSPSGKEVVLEVAERDEDESEA